MCKRDVATRLYSQNPILTANRTSRQKNEFQGNEVDLRVRTANILASTCTSPPECPRVRACGTPNPTSLWPEYWSSLKCAFLLRLSRSFVASQISTLKKHIKWTSKKSQWNCGSLLKPRADLDKVFRLLKRFPSRGRRSSRRHTVRCICRSSRLLVPSTWSESRRRNLH